MDGELSTIRGYVAIVPAAGSGSRMNTDIPKQYLKIHGRSILEITLGKLLRQSSVQLLILVVAAEDQQYASLPNIDDSRIVIIEGGDSRQQSVYNALQFLCDNGLSDNVPVMIHDAARPCVTSVDLDNLCSSFEKSQTACFLASRVVDTLHEIDDENRIIGTLGRNKLVGAQTPQMGRFIDLKKSHIKADQDNKQFPDDVSVLRYSGHAVEVVLGCANNIKITHSKDLLFAAEYLGHH